MAGAFVLILSMPHLSKKSLKKSGRLLRPLNFLAGTIFYSPKLNLYLIYLSMQVLKGLSISIPNLGSLIVLELIFSVSL